MGAGSRAWPVRRGSRSAFSEDVEDALMMVCLTQLTQGGGAPTLAAAGNEELFATGCPALEGRITRHGGAVGVLEESGGEGGGS